MILAICSVGELFGGVERHILGMSTWLQREGHEFVLILFHDNELAKKARDIGVEPIILETRGSFDLTAPGKLARILEDKGVGVVHAHGYRAVVNCALAREKYNFAMVRTVHGLVESSGRWTLDWFKGSIYTWLERFLGRRARAAVTYVTEDLRLRHTKYDGGLVIKTIHNGIDPLNREDYSRPEDLEPGMFHLAAVGRVTQIKGLEYAIRAVAELDPELNVVLNIIGNGPLTSELKDLAGELAISDRVRFWGFVENVYEYMAHIEVLIMPSLHEGLPYTVLEAMSLGIPIIASRVGGIGEILENGKSAVLFYPGDIDELIESLAKSAQDVEHIRALGRASKRVQAEQFNLNIMGKKYWEFFLSLTTNRVD